MTADGILAQIAIQGFSGLLTNLTTEYIRRPSRRIKNDGDAIKRDLSEHLEATFKKCMTVKTILNDAPSQTLSIYVDQSFAVLKRHFDQYEMIDHIRSGNSTVILGAGGGGKSMFMRYLWLSFFEKSEGKIPFFLELRNLNGVSHNSLLDFVFHSIIRSGSSIRQDAFTNAIKNGEFVLFLDGFDEINYDRRDDIQNWILNLK